LANVLLDSREARGLKDKFLANVLLDSRVTDITNLTICFFTKEGC